jgi:hypothetical protein
MAVAPPNAGEIAALLDELAKKPLRLDPLRPQPRETPSRALLRSLAGEMLDAEGAARLLEVGYVEAVAADESTGAQHATAPPKQVDTTPFVAAAHAAAVTTPEERGPLPATDLTFYAAIRDRHHETIVDFDELGVPADKEAATKLLEAAWLLAGRAGATSIAELLTRRAADEARAAANARERARQYRLSRSGDVSGTPDVMLEPPSRQVDLDLEAARLADRARRYDAAVTTMAHARSAVERRAAGILDAFAEDAALVTREYLAASRKELKMQAERYGLQPRDVYTYEDVTGARLAPAGGSDAVASLTKLLVKVVETRESIKSMKRDADSFTVLQPLLGLVALFKGELAVAPGDPRYGPQAPTRALLERVSRDERDLRVEVGAAIAGYVALRSAATTAHPVLRFVAETAKVKNGKIGEEHLAVEVARALKRVHEADNEIEKRLRGYPMWALHYPLIVAETLRRRTVSPVSFEDAVVRDAVAERKERKEAAEAALSKVWTGAGLVMGALGFFAGGGLGVFAVMALYDMLDVLKEFSEYEQERMLYASSLEETLAFAQEDPSATSVALSVAFGIVGNVL